VVHHEGRNCGNGVLVKVQSDDHGQHHMQIESSPTQETLLQLFSGLENLDNAPVQMDRFRDVLGFNGAVL
jgi:hypothetical protein